MKKIKLLPLLCVAPFALTGCNKVNKPHFANKGDKVSTEKFEELLDARLEKSTFITSEKIPSFEVTYSMKTSYESVFKRGKKTVHKSSSFSRSKSSTKVDTKNNVAEEKQNYRGVVKTKDKEGKSREVYKSKEHIFYQEASKDGKKYLAQVNANKKEYKLSGTVGREFSIEDAIQSYAQEELTRFSWFAFGFIENNYDDEDATCYNKKDVFTVELKEEDNYTETGVSEEDIVFTEKSVAKSTYQVQFLKNDGIKFVMYDEYTFDREFKQAFEEEDSEGNSVNATKGDTHKYTTKSSYVIELKKKDVKLKAQKISKYALMNEDIK